MKRLLSLVLSLLLLLSVCACASADTSEPVKFTLSMLELGASSYNDDAVYRYFADKLNFEYEILPITWDNWSEKDRIWINGGTMPDAMFWNFNFTEMVNYADQGLIAPLPDGWETKYPNLYDMVQATGIAEKLKIDGKTYAVPRTTFYQFAPIRKAVSHKSLYYRADWAKELGMEIGPSITVDQLAEYTKKCIEKDFAGNGKTLGIAANVKDLLYLGLRVESPAYDGFQKVDGKYIWGPQNVNTVAGIERLRTWYNEGIIDPDFYLDGSSEPINKFASGLASALISDGSIGNYTLRLNDFATANPDMKALDHVGITTLVNNEGEWVSRENSNFWTAFLFSPELIEDEVKFDRILSLIDLTATKESQAIINMGIKGVDWDDDGNGGYKILREANADGSYSDIKQKYPSIYLWYVFAVMADDFTFVDPTIDQTVKDRVISLYEVRGQSKSYHAYDPDYEFFNSESKSQYSVNIVDEVARLILNQDADIAAEWNNFIEANRPIWEPVVNDLNAAFAQ